MSTSLDALAVESGTSAGSVTGASAGESEPSAVPTGEALTQQTTSSETPAAEALKHGHRALRAFESQQFQEAYDEFAEAESLAHSPVFVVYQARAAEQLGQLLEARDLYREAANEELTASSPGTWRDAASEASGRLELIELRIPRVRLRFQGELRFPLTVVVGAREQQVDVETIAWEELPGEYEVRVRDSSGRQLVQHWSAKEGADQVEVAFVFEQLSKQPRTNGGRAAAESERGVSSQKLGAYTAFAAGGLGLVLGTVLGSVALAETKSLKARCPGPGCVPEEDEALEAKIRNIGDLSTVGFAIGIAGALTGGVLFFTAPSEVDDSAHASAGNRIGTTATAFPQLQVGVSPHGVQILGRF